MPFVNGFHDDGRQIMASDISQKACVLLSIRKTSVYIVKIGNYRKLSGAFRKTSDAFP